MASGKPIEELRAAARAAGLSPSEENFVCFDWARSAAWQEYLMNLYPTPPLNRLLKWKKKFYKTHQVLFLPISLPATIPFLFRWLHGTIFILCLGMAPLRSYRILHST